MMLDVNPETVCHIIARAREFHAQEQVVIPEPGLNSVDDWAREVLADHAGDLTLQEARLAIEDLEPDQQICLVALMWLGREDYDLSEWEEALREARDQWTGRTAEYLLATPLVADYLEAGLSEHGYTCESP